MATPRLEIGVPIPKPKLETSAPLPQPKLYTPAQVPVPKPQLTAQKTPLPQPKLEAATQLLPQPRLEGLRPVVNAIIQAKERGAPDELILQKIIESNPDKAPVFQEALSRGATPSDVINEILRQNNGFRAPDVEQPLPQGRGGVLGLGIGVLKGIANTANNASKFGQKALQKITGIDQEVASLNPELTTPTSTAQKIGFGAEQIAEFFLPGGVVVKGTKAVEGAKAVSKLPKAVQGLAKLGARAGLEGASAAGVTALQGGDTKDIKTAGVLGAGFSVAAKPIEKLIQKLPETAWTSILKRTPSEAAKNPKLTEQATKTGLTGFSRQSIANKADKAIQAIEVSLDDLLSKSKGTVNTAKVAGYLGDLRTAYASIPGEQASVKAIDDIASQLFESFKNGKPLSLVQANQLKRNIYGMIAKSYGKGMLEVPAKTEAQKLIAAGLKREVEKIIPEVKSLNQRQAVYIQVKKALDKTIARTEGKGIAGTGIGLYDLLLGGIGTGAGAATGNPLLGLGFVAAKKTAESPLVLSGTAKLLTYFNELSPTKRLLFYNALQGLVVKSGTALNSPSQKTTK